MDGQDLDGRNIRVKYAIVLFRDLCVLLRHTQASRRPSLAVEAAAAVASDPAEDLQVRCSRIQ